MTRSMSSSPVLHVLDGTCDASTLQAVGALRARLGGADLHPLCGIHGEAARRQGEFLNEPVAAAPLRLGRWFHYAARLNHLASRCGAGLVHAWGQSALAAAAAIPGAVPRVVTVLDPAQTRDFARVMLAAPTQVAVVAATQVIRTRLLTAGVAPQHVVVIRGPADFKAVNAAQNSELRASVAPGDGPVVLMHGPASRGGGQYYGLWAAAIVRQIHRNLRVILPYESHETKRLLRFVRSIGVEAMVIAPDRRLTWPQLAACADVFLAPAREEICVEPLASAMAARLVIVGSAVRSIAEMIADRSNGLLVKRADPKLLSAQLLTAIEDTALARTVTDTARAQAYEVFSLRQYADNYEKLYDNVRSGRLPGEGISDSAMVA